MRLDSKIWTMHWFSSDSKWCCYLTIIVHADYYDTVVLSLCIESVHLLVEEFPGKSSILSAEEYVYGSAGLVVFPVCRHRASPAGNMFTLQPDPLGCHARLFQENDNENVMEPRTCLDRKAFQTTRLKPTVEKRVGLWWGLYYAKRSGLPTLLWNRFTSIMAISERKDHH